MPGREDIDPADFANYLSNVLLVDVEGIDEDGLGIFRYRVVGTGERVDDAACAKGLAIQDSHRVGPVGETVELAPDTVTKMIGGAA